MIISILFSIDILVIVQMEYKFVCSHISRNSHWMIIFKNIFILFYHCVKHYVQIPDWNASVTFYLLHLCVYSE